MPAPVWHGEAPGAQHLHVAPPHRRARIKHALRHVTCLSMDTVIMAICLSISNTVSNIKQDVSHHVLEEAPLSGEAELADRGHGDCADCGLAVADVASQRGGEAVSCTTAQSQGSSNILWWSL